MLKNVTVSGQYTGNNKRGTVIGGINFLPNAPIQTVVVTEETYLKLAQGHENGWFKIAADNYASFCASRKNAATGTFNTKSEMVPVEDAVKVEEEPVQVATLSLETAEENEKAEEVAEEEKVETKKTAKKTTKKTKTEDAE